MALNAKKAIQCLLTGDELLSTQFPGRRWRVGPDGRLVCSVGLDLTVRPGNDSGDFRDIYRAGATWYTWIFHGGPVDEQWWHDSGRLPAMFEFLCREHPGLVDAAGRLIATPACNDSTVLWTYEMDAALELARPCPICGSTPTAGSRTLHCSRDAAHLSAPLAGVPRDSVDAWNRASDADEVVIRSGRLAIRGRAGVFSNHFEPTDRENVYRVTIESEVSPDEKE